jgi:7,8-dihydropterin-6-yl-methyl-4-(beta-D-ribofuranosyl)aminobenzene 5'-phosphate synthase
LTKLDFVVMSHRHGDHMGGLSYLLSVNPKVKIYAPKEGFGVYGGDLPATFYRKDPSLPQTNDTTAGHRRTSCASARVAGCQRATRRQNIEIGPDIHIVTLVSDKPGTLELRASCRSLSRRPTVW